MKIHPTAIVEDGAELGIDVEVGPFTHIHAGARIGDRTKIQSHVCIWGSAEIGEDNEIYPYCAIGASPQIIGDPSPHGRVVIGSKNIFREAVQIHRGSSRGDLHTRIGNENFIMTSVHVGHDSFVGNKIVIASYTGLAGHATIFDSAIIGGGSGISQFVRVGSYVFTAGHSRMEKDLPPFLCTKEFNEVTGPNLVGMKRAGFGEDDTRIVKEIYKALYLTKGKTVSEQMQWLSEKFKGKPVFDLVDDFVKNSKRGIMRP